MKVNILFGSVFTSIVGNMVEKCLCQFGFQSWCPSWDLLMLGKCNPLSQLREHDVKIQNTHAEHYRESNNVFSNMCF